MLWIRVLTNKNCIKVDVVHDVDINIFHKIARKLYFYLIFPYRQHILKYTIPVGFTTRI